MGTKEIIGGLKETDLKMKVTGQGQTKVADQDRMKVAGQDQMKVIDQSHMKAQSTQRVSRVELGGMKILAGGAEQRYPNFQDVVNILLIPIKTVLIIAYHSIYSLYLIIFFDFVS